MNVLRKAALATALCAAMGAAHAADLTLMVASHHIDPTAMRQYNPGIGIEQGPWNAGGYINSIDRHSIYAGYALQEGHFGVDLGAITGYQARTTYTTVLKGRDNYTTWTRRGYTPGAVGPLVAPFVRFAWANIVFVPDVAAPRQSAIALQLRIQLP